MSVQTRLFTFAGTVLAVALTATGLAPTSLAGTSAIALPAAVVYPAPPSKALPAAVDVRTPYEAQVSCDPRVQPGVAAFAALMRAHYKTGVAGTNRGCLRDISEHYDGRALDWMVGVKDPRQKAIANSVTAWLSANNGAMARRFGISYMIWNYRMWREYEPARGWVRYTGPVGHTDHIHFSFSWDGARKRTSWWTGKATKVVDLGPCRVYAGQFAPLYKSIRTAACPTRLLTAPYSPYSVYTIGQRSSQIAVAQRILGLTADGQFGMGTFAALVSWQTRAGVPVTGVLDKATWARLARTAPAPPSRSKPVVPVPSAARTPYTAYKTVVLRQGSRGSAVVFLQRALKVTADGAFGSGTRAAVVRFQKQQGISADGIVGRMVWDRLEKRAYPLVAYRSLTLRQGSSGAAVVALQRALRLAADGAFGSKTVAAVKVVQSGAKLSPTGVVSGATWLAVEKQMPR